MLAFARALLLLWLLAVAARRGAGAAPEPAAPALGAPAAVVLRIYVREGCPHCTDAKQALERLQAERPALRIDYRWVDRDAAARDELVALSKAQGAWPPGVPTFVLHGQVI